MAKSNFFDKVKEKKIIKNYRYKYRNQNLHKFSYNYNKNKKNSHKTEIYNLFSDLPFYK